jgi:hypothetical protein
MSRLGDDRTEAARTHESGDRNDDTDEQDDEIAHLSILARTASPGIVRHQQFAIDTLLTLVLGPPPTQVLSSAL